MRKLFATATLLVAITSCGKSKLGTYCRKTDDCGGGALVCGTKDIGLGSDASGALVSALDHVCLGLQKCKTSADCEGLGEHSVCIGLGTCVRQCRQDADCPEMTYCYEHAFCSY